MGQAKDRLKTIVDHLNTDEKVDEALEKSEWKVRL